MKIHRTATSARVSTDLQKANTPIKTDLKAARDAKIPIKDSHTFECVVDTNVLQKANAPLTNTPKERSKFLRRVALLQRAIDRELTILISKKLLTEYQKKIIEPRNDYIRLFLELLTNSEGAVLNWHSPWNGDRQKARDCRFPSHDDHVLRTAIRKKNGSTIYTEEKPMLALSECLHLKFNVKVEDL